KLCGALFVTVVGPQLSPVTGVPRFTFVAAHCPLLAVTVTNGGHVIVGGWLSVTITVCTQFAVLPLASRTVHVTRFVPTGKLCGALFVTVVGPQLSPVTGVPRFTFVAAHCPLFGATVTNGGHVIVGGWLSVTITVCTQFAVLPLASRTVHVTRFVPTGKL